MVMERMKQKPIIIVNLISKKNSKVRWFPGSSSMFVTGSYGDENNKISVWQFKSLSNENDGDIKNGERDSEPYEVASYGLHGDVTDLKVVSEEAIFASLYDGSIFVLKFSDQHLKLVHLWKSVHKFQNNRPAATTGISVKGNSVASVNENGDLYLFELSTKNRMREFLSDDLCSLTCVTHLRHNEIITGNSLGEMRLYDLRNPSSRSSCLLSLSQELGSITCMNVHPTQPHILATGFCDGSVSMWDMRQRKSTSLVQAHAEPINELLFNPSNPDFFFTCSQDSLLQWDASKLKSYLPSYGPNLEPEETQEYATRNPWLNCEEQTNKLDITEIYTQSWAHVNSLDITDTTLVWVDNTETVFRYKCF